MPPVPARESDLQRTYILIIQIINIIVKKCSQGMPMFETCRGIIALLAKEWESM
jgi:glutamine amidotransferase PdxT